MSFGRAWYLDWQEKISARRSLRLALRLFGVYSVLIFGLLGVYLALHSLRTFWQGLAALVLARLVLVPLIDLFYRKQRPYQKYSFDVGRSALLLRPSQKPDAFPSQHVTSLAAISMAIWFFSPALAVAALVLTALTGLARIVLGYHDLYDILGGILIGGALGFILAVFTR